MSTTTQRVPRQAGPRVVRQGPSRAAWFILALAVVLIVGAATFLFVGSPTTTITTGSPGGVSGDVLERRTEQLWENKQAAAQGYLAARHQPSATGERLGSPDTPGLNARSVTAARGRALARNKGI